jgi:hypothetical protein
MPHYTRLPANHGRGSADFSEIATLNALDPGFMPKDLVATFGDSGQVGQRSSQGRLRMGAGPPET